MPSVTREADANAWPMTMCSVDVADAKARGAGTKGGRRELLVGEGVGMSREDKALDLN